MSGEGLVEGLEDIVVEPEEPGEDTDASSEEDEQSEERAESTGEEGGEEEEGEGEEEEGPDEGGEESEGEEEEGDSEEEGEGWVEEEAEEGTEEEAEEEEATEDFLFSLVVNGQEKEVSFEEMRDAAQKHFAGDESFRRAAQQAKGAQAALEAFSDVNQPAIAGIPAPALAHIQWLQARHGITFEQAENLYVQKVIDPFAAKLLEESDNPMSRRLRAREIEIQSLRRRQASMDSQTKQESERRAFNDRLDRGNVHYMSTIREAGIDDSSIEAQEIKKILVDRAKAGGEITREVVKSAVAATADRHKAIRERALQSLSPEEILEKYPDLAKKILKKAATQKGPTKGRKALRPATGRPTKPRRRSTKETIVDFLSDLSEDR